MSDTDVVALETIPLLDLSYGYAVSSGNLAEVVSALDLVYDSLSIASVLDLLDCQRIEIDAVLVPVQTVFMCDEGICKLIRYAENVFAVVAGDDVVAILRIKTLKLLKWRSCKLAHLLEVNHLSDLECVCMCRHWDCQRLDTMLFMIF